MQLELGEPEHCSGLAPIAKKIKFHDAQQKREDVTSRRAPDV